jgi:enoyl-CoA hydratase/carnithine racemase
MHYEDLRFELVDGVATITLDRPEQMNAFSGPMGESLGRAYRRCDEDDAVRAVVLTGAGERAFCAGADLSGGADAFGSQDEAAFSATPSHPTAFEIRKPVIAAMNGHAVGIGLTLALHCDLRIAAREAKYGVLQVRRGMMPDCCAHWTLPRIVGMERAAYLMLTGRKVTGEEAVELGLALRAVPGDAVLGEAQAIARDIAENAAPLSVAITKRLLWQSPGMTVGEVEHAETELHHHLMGGLDAVEGGLAYLERRPPRWTRSVSRDWPDWPTSPNSPESPGSLERSR